MYITIYIDASHFGFAKYSFGCLEAFKHLQKRPVLLNSSPRRFTAFHGISWQYETAAYTSDPQAEPPKKMASLLRCGSTSIYMFLKKNTISLSSLPYKTNTSSSSRTTPTKCVNPKKNMRISSVFTTHKPCNNSNQSKF